MSDERFLFGKYRGQKIKDIVDFDPDYCEYIIGLDDIDEDLRLYIEELLHHGWIQRISTMDLST